MDKNTGPLVLHIASGDLWAGAEVQLYTLATTLHEALSNPIHVVLLNHGMLEEKLLERGIDITVLDESKLGSLTILHQLIHVIRRIQPDVVHTHRTKENVLGSVAAFIAGRVPSIRTAHGAPEHRPSWRQPHKRLYRKLDLFTGKYLQKSIIAVSDDLASILGQLFPPNKIRVIENGINIGHYHAYTGQSLQISKPADTLRIGIIGRLVPVKRVDIFIRVIRVLLDSRPELKIQAHIIGDGPMMDELEALSAELQTLSSISFEGHCEDIPERLLGLDLLLMTSDHEGLPMILLEAMTLGVPIIAHDTGGISRLLDEGSCGVLVTDHTPDGYVREVCRLAGSEKARKELAIKAQQQVTTHYSAEQNARACRAQYNEVRNPQPARHS